MAGCLIYCLLYSPHEAFNTRLGTLFRRLVLQGVMAVQSQPCVLSCCEADE